MTERDIRERLTNLQTIWSDLLDVLSDFNDREAHGERIRTKTYYQVRERIDRTVYLVQQYEALLASILDNVPGISPVGFAG